MGGMEGWTKALAAQRKLCISVWINDGCFPSIQCSYSGTATLSWKTFCWIKQLTAEIFQFKGTKWGKFQESTCHPHFLEIHKQIFLRSWWVSNALVDAPKVCIEIHGNNKLHMLPGIREWSVVWLEEPSTCLIWLTQIRFNLTETEISLNWCRITNLGFCSLFTVRWTRCSGSPQQASWLWCFWSGVVQFWQVCGFVSFRNMSYLSFIASGNCHVHVPQKNSFPPSSKWLKHLFMGQYSSQLQKLTPIVHLSTTPFPTVSFSQRTLLFQPALKDLQEMEQAEREFTVCLCRCNMDSSCNAFWFNDTEANEKCFLASMDQSGCAREAVLILADSLVFINNGMIHKFRGFVCAFLASPFLFFILLPFDFCEFVWALFCSFRHCCHKPWTCGSWKQDQCVCWLWHCSCSTFKTK